MLIQVFVDDLHLLLWCPREIGLILFHYYHLKLYSSIKKVNNKADNMEALYAPTFILQLHYTGGWDYLLTDEWRTLKKRIVSQCKGWTLSSEALWTYTLLFERQELSGMKL